MAKKAKPKKIKIRCHVPVSCELTAEQLLAADDDHRENWEMDGTTKVSAVDLLIAANRLGFVDLPDVEDAFFVDADRDDDMDRAELEQFLREQLA